MHGDLPEWGLKPLLGKKGRKKSFIISISREVLCQSYVWCVTLRVKIGESIGPKQVQIITMHSKDFKIKDLQSKACLSKDCMNI